MKKVIIKTHARGNKVSEISFPKTVLEQNQLDILAKALDRVVSNTIRQGEESFYFKIHEVED